MSDLWVFLLIWGVWILMPIVVDGLDTLVRLFVVLIWGRDHRKHDIPDEELPYITILVPAYNEEQVIDRCLNSIKIQDYPQEKLEVVVINDGSTDYTAERVMNHIAGEFQEGNGNGFSNGYHNGNGFRNGNGHNGNGFSHDGGNHNGNGNGYNGNGERLPKGVYSTRDFKNGNGNGHNGNGNGFGLNGNGYHNGNGHNGNGHNGNGNGYLKINGDTYPVPPFNGEISLISNGHIGKPKALNLGIKHMNGSDIVVTLDSDIVLVPHALRNMACAFVENPGMGAATGHIEVSTDILEERDDFGNLILDDEGRLITKRLTWWENLLSRCQFLEYLDAFRLGRQFQTTVQSTYILAGAFSAFTRDVLESSPFYRARTVSEDFDLTADLHRTGTHVGYVADAKALLEPVTSWDGLFSQRVRWSRGQLEVCGAHEDMIGNRKYGPIGWFGFPQMLIIDHTLAFPRLIWTLLLFLFPLLGYPVGTVAMALGFMYLFYVGLCFMQTLAAYSIVDLDTRRQTEQALAYCFILPIYRLVTFYFRMSGYLKSLKEPQEWEVAGPLVTAANGVNGVKNGFNGATNGLKNGFAKGFDLIAITRRIKTRFAIFGRRAYLHYATNGGSKTVLGHLFKRFQLLLAGSKSNKTAGKKSVAQDGKKPNGGSQNKTGRWKNIFITTLAIIFIVGVITTVFWPSLTSGGIPSGVDTPSFLHTARYMVDYMVQHRALPPTDPQWYSGLEYLHYAPPIIYIPIGFFYYLTGNINTAGKLFQVIMMSLVALSMFWVVKKRYNVFSATIAALVYSLAPWVFFQLGSPTKVMASLFLPMSFYLTDKILTEKKNLNVVLLALFLLAALLSHPMMGLIFMAGLSVYALVFSAFSKDVSINRAFLVIGASILAAGLGSYFVIPYYLEKAGWTSIPYQELVNYSHPLSTVFLYTGIPLILLAIYSVIRHRDAVRYGLLAMGVVGGFLALGIYGSGFMYEILPFLKVTYPGLWLNLPVFAAAYLAAIAFDFDNFKGVGADLKKTVVALLIIVIAIAATSPIDNFTMLRNSQSQLPDVTVSTILNTLKDNGRVAPLKYPFGYLIYELSERTDKNIVEGHYYGLARTGKYLSWNYDAIDHGYLKYPLSNLAHNNVEYVVVNGNLLNSRKRYGKQFIKELLSNGYRKIQTVVGYYGTIYDIYERTQPSSYLVPVQEKTLIVGSYAYTAAAILSEKAGVVIGGSTCIDDYSEDVLSEFKTVILYGFSYRDRTKAENLIKSFVKNGGQVVIDLYGAKPYGVEADPSFLGVTGSQKVADKPFTIEKLEKRADDYFAYNRFTLPKELSENGQKETALKEWRYVEYVGLDEPLARLADDKLTDMVIAGFKRVEGGDILFLGPNAFYHTYLTHNEDQINKLATAFTDSGSKHAANSENGATTEITNPKVYKQSIEPDRIMFKYTSQHDFPAFISYAYSAHWKAYVDGYAVPITNIEDLMLVRLPKGNHTLTVLYEDTPIHIYARGVTIATLLFLGWLLWRDRRKRLINEAKHGQT